MSVVQGYTVETPIDRQYVLELVEKLKPDLESLTGGVNPKHDFALRSTIYKVLSYINSLILPEALEDIIVEMCARQMSEYDDGLSSEREEGAVKRVQRGGFTQEFETKQSATAVPRGTQIMQDYIKFLNKYKKMRTV